MREALNNAKSNKVGPDRHDDRNFLGQLLCCDDAIRISHDDVDLQIDQLLQQDGNPASVSLRSAIFDLNVLSLDVTEVAKTCPEGVVILGRSRDAEISDPGRPLRLLCMSCERPRRSCATGKRYELAPLHCPPCPGALRPTLSEMSVPGQTRA